MKRKCILSDPELSIHGATVFYLSPSEAFGLMTYRQVRVTQSALYAFKSHTYLPGKQGVEERKETEATQLKNRELLGQSSPVYCCAPITGDNASA